MILYFTEYRKIVSIHFKANLPSATYQQCGLGQATYNLSLSQFPHLYLVDNNTFPCGCYGINC